MIYIFRQNCKARFNSKIVDLLEDSGFSVLNEGQLIYASHEGFSCHTDERLDE